MPQTHYSIGTGYVTKAEKVGDRWKVTVVYRNGQTVIYDNLTSAYVAPCTNVSAGTPIGDTTDGEAPDISVGLTMPAQFTVNNSPLTNSGTLGVVWKDVAEKMVLASPVNGTGQPEFRKLQYADIEGTPDVNPEEEIDIVLVVGSPGAPADGANTYSNAALAGRKYHVLREGFLQSEVGANPITININGTIGFVPDLHAPEVVRITNKPTAMGISMGASGVFIKNEVPMGAIDGVNKVFTTVGDFADNSTQVYKNKERQDLGVSGDYVESGPNEITFVVAPSVGNKLIIDYELK